MLEAALAREGQRLEAVLLGGGGRTGRRLGSGARADGRARARGRLAGVRGRRLAARCARRRGGRRRRGDRQGPGGRRLGRREGAFVLCQQLRRRARRSRCSCTAGSACTRSPAPTPAAPRGRCSTRSCCSAASRRRRVSCARRSPDADGSETATVGAELGAPFRVHCRPGLARARGAPRTRPSSRASCRSPARDGAGRPLAGGGGRGGRPAARVLPLGQDAALAGELGRALRHRRGDPRRPARRARRRGAHARAATTRSPRAARWRSPTAPATRSSRGR